ncbi:hypothetical protein EV384_3478 [Micromonospora kangleipakensis]|uniref:Uncharacterized protein n=1 Tax=Micromonospora kangleipakensis TaxID=1077942 RepID=A0A4Q8BAZ9_9ACTN|nr:hypothetical protein EV384_3478 [Micromonospora kangleipakensis]
MDGISGTHNAEHYNGWRPHRALHPTPPRSARPAVNADHRRIARAVLGGLIKAYDRVA